MYIFIIKRKFKRERKCNRCTQIWAQSKSPRDKSPRSLAVFGRGIKHYAKFIWIPLAAKWSEASPVDNVQMYIHTIKAPI